MSGGVDSSVAAYLMKEAGYDVTGFRMRLFAGAESETADAQKVADKLGFPFTEIDFEEEFNKKVIDQFIAAYENGETPNPCIVCNKHLKFGQLYDEARAMGMDYIVTGHYSRIDQDPETGKYRLHKAEDPSKDQSYVLYNLTQDQLAHTLFPLGGMNKEQARQIAEDNDLINARKKDSQDICFVPDGDYVKFIKEYTGKDYPCGDFVDEAGNVLGEHKGIIKYTVGQRKGLGLALPQPMYVKEKDVENNRVVLCLHETLFTTDLDAKEFNWISGEVPEGPIECKARARYNQKEQPATVTATGPDTVHVKFHEPLRAITKGQSVVLYDGDIVLGGGIII